MDEIDLAILLELQNDARTPLKEIGVSVCLSLPAVSERVRKLERSRVIERYTAILNPEKFNKTLSCYCFLSLADKAAETDRKFRRFICCETDIVSGHCITGQYEYILKIMTESTKSLEKLLARIRHEALVQITNTFVILSTIKEQPSIYPDSSGTKAMKTGRRAKHG